MSSSSKNFSLAALVLALLAMGTLAWWQSRRITELESKIAQAAADSLAAQQRATNAEQRLATAEKRRSELETQNNEPRARAAAERARTTANNATPRVANAGALENPAVQRMLATGMRGALDQRFGTLFRQLKLSPAQLEKFKDLLTERQMSALDAMTAARTQGVNSAEMPALMEKVQADVDQSIRQLLGDSSYERYQNFNQNIASYGALEQIERRLSYTNAPLEAAQSDALLRVLIETAPPAPAETTPARNNMLGVVQSLGSASPLLANLGGTAISNQTIERASGILTPAQTDVLRQLQAEQAAQMNVVQGVRVINAITGAGAANTDGFQIVTPGTAGTAPQPTNAPAPRR